LTKLNIVKPIIRAIDPKNGNIYVLSNVLFDKTINNDTIDTVNAWANDIKATLSASKQNGCPYKYNVNTDV